MEKLFSSNPTVGKYLGYFAAIVTIAGLISATIDNFYDDGNVNIVIYKVTSIFLGIAFLGFINHFFLSVFWSRSNKRATEIRDEERAKADEYIKKILTPGPVLYRRFEKIKSKRELTYGYVEYKPFFWKKDHFDHKGIGLEVLKKVFSEFDTFELRPYNYPGRKQGNNWSDVFIDLCNKEFDIIMTPLFETRSRLYSYNILYCSPIFYSNIGIYLRKNSFDSGTKLKFSESLDFLKKRMREDGWRAESIPGELSQTLLEKYGLGRSDPSSTKHALPPASDGDFTKVLVNVNKDGGNNGDFVFMEVFKANMILNSHPGRLNLINILEDDQLLYPVSFVVRKEETVLKNLINIRLLELRKSGELEKIIKNEALKVNIKEEEFNEIFIQSYDFEKLEA